MDLGNNKKKKKLFNRLKLKYRLVIMNDETFEEKVSLKLTKLNVMVVVGTIIILLIIGTAYIIAFTPLKEFIPGFSNLNIQNDIYELSIRADSLENNLHQKDLYIHNIKNVIEGKLVNAIDEPIKDEDTLKKMNPNYKDKNSYEDSLFRVEMEKQKTEQFVPTSQEENEKNNMYTVRNLLFFTPLKGTIVNTYSVSKKHYGIDIVAGKNEAIKTALDGTIILSTWTLKTGYVIAVQHNSNFVSIYKHNSVLLKKEGDYVKAGEPIAIIGNTGEMSTGSHLHFELWYNGFPVNPIDYISF